MIFHGTHNLAERFRLGYLATEARKRGWQTVEGEGKSVTSLDTRLARKDQVKERGQVEPNHGR